jgi:hypothetical protein
MPLPDAIGNKDDLVQFLRQVTEELGWGFHPDTRFADYVCLLTGEPTYTDEDAALRDALIAQAFALVGDDIYAVGLEVVYQWAGIRYDSARRLLVDANTQEPVHRLRGSNRRAQSAGMDMP